MTEPVAFTIDTTKVQRVFDLMPKVGYFWLRRFLFQSFVEHRVNWLRFKGAKFGRGGNGIRVWRINEGPATGGPKDVTYRVEPAADRAASKQDAIEGLKRMVASTGTGNIVLPVHEFGAKLQARRAKYMAIPVRTRPGSISLWRAKNPAATLISMPSKKNPGDRVVYESVGYSRVKGGGPGKGKQGPVLQRALARPKWRLRFILKRTIEMQKTLHYYANWDVLRQRRDSQWAECADKMLRDFNTNDPRDR